MLLHEHGARRADGLAAQVHEWHGHFLGGLPALFKMTSVIVRGLAGASAEQGCGRC